MDKEVEDYLEQVSKLLSGQLRGAINKKAREENLEFIQITLVEIWNKAVENTAGLIEDIKIFEKLKKELNHDENGSVG